MKRIVYTVIIARRMDGCLEQCDRYTELRNDSKNLQVSSFLKVTCQPDSKEHAVSRIEDLVTLELTMQDLLAVEWMD